jgi:hypothetical protein
VISAIASIMTGVTFLACGCLIDGSSPEPGRFTIFVAVLAFPACTVAGLPFLLSPSNSESIGHCKKCGYDLTGNVSGRCPECGSALD